jgi:hypothetical protein
MTSSNPSSSGTPTRAAMPKSKTFTPTGVRKTLAGLTSRWTMPSAWAAARAEAISAQIWNARAGDIGVGSADSGVPSSSSMTTKGVRRPCGPSNSP